MAYLHLRDVVGQGHPMQQGINTGFEGGSTGGHPAAVW